MCLYIYIYIYIHMYICICVFVYIYVCVCVCVYIYIYNVHIYMYLSISSCYHARTDLTDLLLPSCSIVLFSSFVFIFASCVGGELMYIWSSCSSCLCLSLVRVHQSMSIMSLFLLIQLCPTCLVCLTMIVFMIDVEWPFSCYFVVCCFQD